MRRLIELSLIVSLFCPFYIAVWIFPFILGFLIRQDMKLFKFITRSSFFILVFLLIGLQPLIAGKKDFFLLNLGFSLEVFYSGLFMVIRAIVIIPSITWLSKTMEKAKLKKLSSLLGIKNFDEILTHSQNMFPVIKESCIKYFKETGKRKYYDPVEFFARFIALLIKSTDIYTYKVNKKEIL
ncbi:MAG TPA: hypothetical protein PLT92_05345 [Ignavibacteriaceae bacterium]|jgi:hypothetical protein|nr:hypothetical protein [Ignavibacteriaceae bacterium]HOJ17968.1 hypothetical protein [Ignavibacteriaceae bacterium]HPO54925.1 hypothetical protein [Ignavibacteriaceae bacterium]